MNRRVVITGIGVLAPGGVGVKAFWNLLIEGRTATRRISFFDPSPFRSQVGAEVDFDAESHGLTPQQIRRMDRATQFAVVTAGEAVADSGMELADLDPLRTGVTVGSAVGATMSLDKEYRVVSDGGRRWLVDHEYAVPHLYSHLVPSSIAAEVSWTVGAEGPTAVVSTGCTSGLDAVGYASELIREGSADVMVAGATDAPISPITTIPSTRRGRLTTAATGSCWARARRSSCWRIWTTPGSGGFTSSPRSRDSPPGATPFI
jgi:act minimal PKS ketosynthase (KS/KS alpha)